MPGTTAHLKTEFGFDTVSSEDDYAPEQFHDFIGFQVSEPSERVSHGYGLELKDVLPHEDLAIGFMFLCQPPIGDDQVAFREKRTCARDAGLFQQKFSHAFPVRIMRVGKILYKAGLGTSNLITLLRFVPK